MSLRLTAPGGRTITTEAMLLVQQRKYYRNWSLRRTELVSPQYRGNPPRAFSDRLHLVAVLDPSPGNRYVPAFISSTDPLCGTLWDISSDRLCHSSLLDVPCVTAYSLGMESTGGYDALKAHAFFEGFDWKALEVRCATHFCPHYFFSFPKHCDKHRHLE